MPEQKVSSLGLSHRSSKCQSKRLPLWGQATARANDRAKGYLPGAKPPLEQMPEQKVTSLGPSHPSSKCQSKRLPPKHRVAPRAAAVQQAIQPNNLTPPLVAPNVGPSR